MLATWLMSYFSYCGSGAVKYFPSTRRLVGLRMGKAAPDW
jgi:hypothetical protein